MRVPLGWLAEWVDLPDSRDELLDRLTAGGLEIDGVELTGPDLSAIRVGHVMERNAHPNADRLAHCIVDVGEAEPVEIVCGAPNVDVGQKVAVALAGVVLPDGTKLKKSKIRGVVSNGMICSESELGLGEGHEGILVLDPGVPIGASLDTVVRVGETVLDVAITPNRGDCTSMLGMAREVRAHFGGPLRLPETAPPEVGGSAADEVGISIEDADGCFRYAARVVYDVRVGPSPDWLVERLEAAGLRSINVVVDITNLVLLEFGQPLHAFDLEMLSGREIRVRAAEAGEKIRTLDGEVRELATTDLVIADADKPIAIAGLMGGADTEVRERTTQVLLESAHFEPVRIRRTARRLALQTEASYRFERGVDFTGIGRAVDRAARLLAELAGGSVRSGVVGASGAPTPPPREIALDPAHPNRLLGTSFTPEELIALLDRVGIPAKIAAEGQLCCRVPPHRNDIAIAQDLIEEVARIYGYDRIPTRMPQATMRPVVDPPRLVTAECARDALRAEGLHEARLSPMFPPEDLNRLRLGPDDPRRRCVRLLNPMIEAEGALRPSLVPTLLSAVERNLAHQVQSVRLFEVATVFLPESADALPNEPLHAAAVVLQEGRQSLWDAPQGPRPFYQLKGALERLIGALGRQAGFVPIDPELEPYLHPGAAATVIVGGKPVGAVGELHPETARRYGIEAPCAILSVDLSGPLGQPATAARYHDVSRFPAVRRDIAVLVDAAQPAAELVQAIRKTAGSALVDVGIFDRYEGKGVPEGKVSLAFRLVLQLPDRTLKDTEVAKATERVRNMLAHRFGGELR